MEQRSYNQYCATARTLDVLGERWTLLLIRELLTGPKRFTDLQKSLYGLSTGLLSTRLKHLEQHGVVARTTLPAPARTPAYALTDAGQELAPAMVALSRWGMNHVMAEPPREDEIFHPAWAVFGMTSTFNPAAAEGLHATYEFRIGDEVLHADIDDGAIKTVYGPAQRPDVVISTDRDVFLGLSSGRTTLSEAVQNGVAAVIGDEELVRRLSTLFTVPRNLRPELPEA